MTNINRRNFLGFTAAAMASTAASARDILDTRSLYSAQPYYYLPIASTDEKVALYGLDRTFENFALGGYPAIKGSGDKPLVYLFNQMDGQVRLPIVWFYDEVRQTIGRATRARDNKSWEKFEVADKDGKFQDMIPVLGEVSDSFKVATWGGNLGNHFSKTLITEDQRYHLGLLTLTLMEQGVIPKRQRAAPAASATSTAPVIPSTPASSTPGGLPHPVLTPR